MRGHWPLNFIGPVKYLITGATGFIGRELYRQLADGSVTVVPLSRGGGPLSDGTASLAVDLVHAPPADELMRDVDTVFHLAGIAHRQAPESAYEQLNYRATLALAAAAAAAGARCFVFLSSVKAMGPAGSHEPRNEEDCRPPVGAYASSKWRAECALRELYADSPMAVVILRPALVYGSGAAGNLALLVGAVRRGLPRPPAGGERSMIARQDLASLLCHLGEEPPRGVHTWIVCDGQRYSTRRLFDAMRAALGRGPGISWCPRWLWRLAAGLIDLCRGRSGGSTYERLFGDELYCGAALLSARQWRPRRRFEDTVADLMARRLAGVNPAPEPAPPARERGC